MTEQVGDHIDATPCIRGVVTERMPQPMSRDRPVADPSGARASNSSPIASGRIGAPIGSRNRFTITKSPAAAPAPSSARTRTYRRPARAGNPTAPPAAAGTSPTPHWDYPPGGPHAHARGRSRTPTNENRSADAHHCVATRTTPRAATQPGPSTTQSTGLAPTGTHPTTQRYRRRWPDPSAVHGSCNRCRARIRHDIGPSPLRAACGRSRRPPRTAPTTDSRPPARYSPHHHHRPHRGQHPVDPPGPAGRDTTRPGRTTTDDCVRSRETAGPAWANHVVNSGNCSTPASQVRPVRLHHRRNNAIECA